MGYLIVRACIFAEGVLVSAPGAVDGIRTRIASLEGWFSAIELLPHKPVFRPKASIPEGGGAAVRR